MSAPSSLPVAPAPAKSLAMVLATTARMPAPAAFARELAKTRAVKVSHADEAAMTFEVDGEPCFLGLIPSPIPWSQLEGPCATAWWWPEAAAVCKPCPAHYVLAAQSADGNVFTANLRLTAIVAALLRVTGAAAVYWGAGTLVRSADDFCREAATATRDRMPLQLWVDFRVVRESDDSFFFATTGMTVLGLMEIECVVPRAGVDYALGRIFNAAHYLCDRGPVLLDGQTFGLSADEKIIVSHRASRWERPGKVIFLELPAAPG